MKELILHIGTHKTGTTAVQVFMTANEDVLRSYGCAYPIFPFRYPNKRRQRNGMFLTWPYKNAETGKRDKEEEQRRYDLAMDTIHELFKTHDKVVLSDETLWKNVFRRPVILRRLVEDGEKTGYVVKIVIYLRRQDQLLESMWNQLVKSGEVKGKDFPTYRKDYCRNYNYLDYYEVISCYSEIVGEENVTVRRFADIDRSIGISADFMKLIGLELTDEYRDAEETPNTGLYGNTVRIKQLINQVGATSDMTYTEHKLFREGLGMCAGISREEYPCSEFSQEERTAFMEQYEESNERVAQRFIGDGRPLFSTDYSGAPKREDNNPKLLEDVVRETAATDLVIYRYFRDLRQQYSDRERELTKEIQMLKKEIQTLRKQVDSHERRIEHLRHPFKAATGRFQK